MLIREYTPADLDALRRMHASQNFDYAFPNLDDPIFISKLILEDDSGHPVMASLARLTCEMYLLIDRTARRRQRVIPSGVSRAFSFARGAARTRSRGTLLDVSPEDARTAREIPRVARNDNSHGGHRAGNARQRWTQLLALHRAGEQDLLARGLDDAHAWLPPQIARRFGRRLESLGWLRDDTWTPYCKRLKSSG